MEMSVQDLGSIGEFVGAILLLASIVYLAAQIRDTKVQMKASTSQARTAAFTQMWVTKFQPGVVDAELKALNSPDDLTDRDRYLLFNFLLMFMNFYQDTFYQRKLGTLDEEQAGALDTFPMLRFYPIYGDIWRTNMSTGGTFSDEFVAHVNKVLGNDA